MNVKRFVRRCLNCNRMIRRFESYYVVKVWADGLEGVGRYGDRRIRCTDCRQVRPMPIYRNPNWIQQLK